MVASNLWCSTADKCTLSPLPSPSHGLFLGISVSKSPSSYKDPCPVGVGAHTNPGRPHCNLITSAKTLFPNKTTYVSSDWAWTRGNTIHPTVPGETPVWLDRSPLNTSSSLNRNLLFPNWKLILFIGEIKKAGGACCTRPGQPKAVDGAPGWWTYPSSAWLVSLTHSPCPSTNLRRTHQALLTDPQAHGMQAEKQNQTLALCSRVLNNELFLFVYLRILFGWSANCFLI